MEGSRMSNGIEAADEMALMYLNKTTGVKGMCLKTCRIAYGIPPKYPSAIAAWKATKRKFKDPTLAPIGAAHFWEIGRFGHIAIQSRQAGQVWSTDAPLVDRVGKVRLEWFAQNWGAKYLGWTDQVNGKTIELSQMPRKRRPKP
jgi:hypothetical protein